MRRLHRLLPVVALLSSPVMAFNEFASEIPNGSTVSCQGCHERTAGGSPWNDFGDLLFTTNGGTVEDSGSVDGFDAGFIWWNAAICGADTDGDGQTNGQELGDPDCVWTKGADEGRTTDISRPGDDASTSADPDGGAGGGGGGGGDGGDGGDEGGCSSAGASVGIVALLPALLVLGRRRQLLTRRR